MRARAVNGQLTSRMLAAVIAKRGQHVEKRFVRCSVTYKRRKVGPELNGEKKRESL